MSLAVRALLLLGFLLLGLLLGGVRVNAAPKLLVLGDSISAAYGMSLEQGWVTVLAQRLRGQWPDSAVVNASISGDTSAGGLRRLPPLLERHAPDLLIIELGGNDGLRGYPTTQLRENLVNMVRAGQDAGAQVLILPMEIPPNYGPRYTSAFRASFTAATEQTGATLGPFLLENIATDTALMQEDGIHPTVSAQPMIVDILLPVIRQLLDEGDA